MRIKCCTEKVYNMYSWHPLFKYVEDAKLSYLSGLGLEEVEVENFDVVVEGNEVFNGLIMTSYKDFVLFKYKNYVELADLGYGSDFFELYNGLYLECRSVVFNTYTGEIVLAPQKKFKNFGEDENEWSRERVFDKLNNAKKVEISNKLDGSNQNFRYYNGEYIGSGSQALDVNESWRLKNGYNLLTNEYKAMLKDYPDEAFLFEYISPDNPIVVYYTKEQEGLYLFGMRNVITGKERTYEEVLEIGKKYGVKTTEVYDDSFDDILNKLDDYKSSEKEGWVIAIWNNDDVFKVKLKVNDYVLMHKALTKLVSPNAIIQAISDGKIDDFYSAIPIGFRESANKTIKQVYDYINFMEAEIDIYYKSLMSAVSDKDGYEQKKTFMILNDKTPKKYRGYVTAKYLGRDYNVLTTGNGQGYKKLGEMQI